MVQRSKFFSMLIVLVFGMLFVSCTRENITLASRTPEEPDVIISNMIAVNELSHDFDTTSVDQAYDNMTNVMTISVMEDGEIVDEVSFTEYPEMATSISVDKTGYTITEDLIDTKVINATIKRQYTVNSASAEGVEKDTLIAQFDDGQIVRTPVEITTPMISFKGKSFPCASDTLLSARIVSAKNVVDNDQRARSRAMYVSQTLTTEYIAELIFGEKNVRQSKNNTVYLKTRATRMVLSEDDIDKVTYENKNRVAIDENTERCSFDKIIWMKSGDKVVTSKSIVLNRSFAGIDPYDKYVTDFGYSFAKANGVTNGTEVADRTEDGWSVFGKTDKYSANLANSKADELVVTDYSFYHERAIYKDAHITVDFGYENIAPTEVSTKVDNVNSDKNAFDKAILRNEIKAEYLKYNHNLSEYVNLYKAQKGVEIEGFLFRDKKLVINDDNVVASMIFVTKYSDQTETTEEISKTFPRSLKCYTNWSVESSNIEPTTGSASDALKSSVKQTEGFWTYYNQTFNVTTNVDFAGACENQTNGWEIVVPNSIVYTREGVTCDFGKIDFDATELGAKIELLNANTYRYTDNLSVIYGDNVVDTTAPGLIVRKVEVEGYEFRDKKLIINDDNVVASMVFVTKYNDGSVNSENISKTFPRSLKCYTNWSVESANLTPTTGSALSELESSAKQTEGFWAYENQTFNVTTPVNFAGACENQTNGWEIVVPNSIVYTREGLTCDFGKIDFKATEAGAKIEPLSGNSYRYTDNLSVVYGDNAVNTTAPGTITSQVKVSSYEFLDKKLVINDNNVVASVVFVTKYSDGTSNRENISKTFPRSLKCNTNWRVESTNVNPTTGSAQKSLKSSVKQTDGFWAYNNQTYTVSTIVNFAGACANQTNSWDAVVPNSIVYAREGLTCDFGTMEFNATELGANISATSANNYNYTDNLSVVYGNNTVKTTAPGTIVGKVTVSGYDIRNQKIVINENNVVASLDFVTIYSDGSEKSEAQQKSFSRSLTVLTNWSAVEANANQSTSSASVSLQNTSAGKDGFWSWNNETRSITTTANLNSSTQNNAWKSVEPNDIVFTREGKTYRFETIMFNAVEAGANVAKKSETDESAVYGYSDKINVMFGSNTVSSVAPGTITVAKENWTPDFPIEWGRFTGAKATVACNEEKKDWVHTLSLHFENGTLPVVIRKSDTTIAIDKSLFANDTNSKFNGAVYADGKWINAIAENASKYMIWRDTNNTPKDMLVYSTATMWNWNNGHNTVVSQSFSFDITNDGAKLIVYKDGKEFATYKTK